MGQSAPIVAAIGLVLCVLARFGMLNDSDSIRDALQGLRHGRRLSDNSLLQTAAVQSYLRAAALLPTSANLEWAAGDLMTCVVRQAWLAQRRSLGLAELDLRAPGQSADTVLAEDFSLGDPKLEAWSCLYFRYVAVCAMQVKEIAAIAYPGSAHGRRSVSRRLSRGYQMLLEELRSIEAGGAVALTAALHAADAPASRRQGSLPRQGNSLVGRAAETQRILERLRPGGLVTIAGPPGVGKTRLAIHVASALGGQLRDGAWFISLSAPAREVAVPVERLAWVLGLPRPAGGDAIATMALQLQSWESLLLFDACEVASEDCAALVAGLLEVCPGLRILATSRLPLHVDGESIHRLRPLALPEPADVDLPERLAQVDSVRLFVDRAAAASGGFRLDTISAKAVAQIVRRLDGLPLAIELVAPRVATLTVCELRDRLLQAATPTRSERTRSGDRSAPLADAIAWSYARLEADERVVLRRLSVFGGGCRLAEAEQVCADGGLPAERVAELMAGLIEQSLVQHEDDHSFSRYLLLECIRVFAAERLEAAGEAEAVRGRHREAYRSLVESALVGVRGHQAGTWLDRIQQEHRNILVALEESQADGPAEALSLATAMMPFWAMMGTYDEGLRWMRRLLDSDLPVDPAERNAGLLAAGELAVNSGNFRAARVDLEEALALASDRGDADGWLAASAALGFTLSFLAEFPAAEEILDRAIAEARARASAKVGLAALLFSRSHVAQSQGQYERVESLATECLGLALEAGVATLAGRAHLMLGYSAHGHGDFGRARSEFSLSISMAQENGDPIVAAAASWGLGRSALAMGDLESTRQLCADGAAVHRRSRAHTGISYLLELAASVAVAENEPHRAVRLLGAAERQRERMSAPLPPAALQDWQVCVSRLQGMLDVKPFAEGWAEGRQWSPAEAIAALGA
jgi:predicted ATPase